MGLRVSGLSKVLANMKRTEERVQKGSLEALRQAAKEVVALARKFAPIDDGDLTEAISAQEVRERTSLGRFGQIEIRVGVDVSKLNLEKRKGFDYSIPMHEGSYNLGPLSRIKQAGQSEQVGPKYLSRALQQLKGKLTKDMEEAIRRAAR